MMNQTDTRVKLTGILGGTFDPVHCGHLLIAEQVKSTFGLDEIIFLPSGEPPHKKGMRVSEGSMRVEMLKLAIESNPYFKVLELEINRKGLTYTVDTLKELNTLHANKVKFYYIIGADVIFDLLTWKRFEDVFKLCEFIAVGRNGFSYENVVNQLKYLEEQHGAVIHFIKCPMFEVSSSYIRDNMQKGKSIKYLVPQKVEEYIKENNLYKDDLICR